MQVLKNLFGLNKKIAASEIAIKNSNGEGVTLDEFLNTLDVYSTEEQIIGTWIDGKPLYRKVLDIGQYTWIIGDNSFAHNIANLDIMINIDYTMQYTNGKWYSNWDGIDRENWVTDTTNLIIASTGDAKFNKFYLILEYTKTTD